MSPNFALLVAVCGAVLISAWQDPARDAALLRRAQQVAVPGAEHQRLARLVGDWNVVATTTIGGEKRETRGTMQATTMLGGRYVALRFSMTGDAGAYEALQLLGFDVLAGQYTTSWRDDLSTWAVDGAGVPSAERPQLITMSGTLRDVRTASGRPFQCELDLSEDHVVRFTLRDGTPGAPGVEQVQVWSRRR